MKRFGLTLWGAVAALGAALAVQPASATVVPNGSEAITSAGGTINTPDISASTTQVTLGNGETTGLFTDPFLSNLNNFCGPSVPPNCGGAHAPGFLAAGDPVTLSALTLPFSGPINEHVTITDAAGDVDFQFNTIALAGPITPTTSSTPGNFNLGLTGTFASDSTSSYTLGETASLSVSCTQSGLGGTVGCGLSIATPSVIATPEPASLALLGSALLGFGWLRRRRNNT